MDLNNLEDLDNIDLGDDGGVDDAPLNVEELTPKLVVLFDDEGDKEVLYNLGLLSFTEIEREMATLKVLGFKTRALRKLLLTQNLWFTTIGFILGIPVGYYILKIMWDSSGDSFYILPSISITNLIMTALITFTLSILVNLMFSRKIKKLDMVESLKSAE